MYILLACKSIYETKLYSGRCGEAQIQSYTPYERNMWDSSVGNVFNLYESIK